MILTHHTRLTPHLSQAQAGDGEKYPSQKFFAKM
jgi:hypothetical protein